MDDCLNKSMNGEANTCQVSNIQVSNMQVSNIQVSIQDMNSSI